MTSLTAPSQVSGGATPTGRPAPTWRERSKVLGLVVAALVLVAIGWRVLAGGPEAAPPAPPTTAYVDRALGVRLGHPPAWTVERHGRARRIISSDRSIVVVVTSPAPGSYVRRVRRDAQRALLRGYRPARVVGRAPGRLGRQRVLTTELVATSPSGKPIRILSIATASRWRTYAFAVISTNPPRATRFLEAQQILRSVAFQRPVKRR